MIRPSERACQSSSADTPLANAFTHGARNASSRKGDIACGGAARPRRRTESAAHVRAVPPVPPSASREMAKDPADDPRLFDDRDQTEPSSTARARQHVESETALHQLRPEQVRLCPRGGARPDPWPPRRRSDPEPPRRPRTRIRFSLKSADLAGGSVRARRNWRAGPSAALRCLRRWRDS